MRRSLHVAIITVSIIIIATTIVALGSSDPGRSRAHAQAAPVAASSYVPAVTCAALGCPNNPPDPAQGCLTGWPPVDGLCTVEEPTTTTTAPPAPPTTTQPPAPAPAPPAAPSAGWPSQEWLHRLATCESGDTNAWRTGYFGIEANGTRVGDLSWDQQVAWVLQILHDTGMSAWGSYPGCVGDPY